MHAEKSGCISSRFDNKLLSSINNYSKDNANLDQMKNLSSQNKLSNSQIVDLSFALGKAYEDLKEYESSYLNLKKANLIKEKEYNYKIEEEELLIESIKKSFEDLNLNNDKKIFEKRKAIFICGMPRSGTTLVEQIIASHKDVFGAGELIYLQRIINKYFIYDKKFSKDKLVDEIELSNNNINQDYFKMINYHNFNENNFTDKAPQNFRWIGIIKLFFPNSKIILCKRNYISNAISIYKNNFNASSYNWTNDPKDILSYFRYYSKIINLWKNKFPDELFEIEYEELVEKRELMIKKIINICDLDWDPNCLLFYKSKIPIKTASAFQARQPIYKSSVSVDSSSLKNVFLEQDFKDI